MIRPKSQKRAREKARVDRQKENERRRSEARERKANAPPRTGEEDPDLAGIQPGPQPPPDWLLEENQSEDQNEEN